MPLWWALEAEWRYGSALQVTPYFHSLVSYGERTVTKR